MTEEMFYSHLAEEFNVILKKHKLFPDKMKVKGGPLTAQEAIGITRRQDFPIITGKEAMLQVDIQGHTGQSFTDAACIFSGTLADILNMDIQSDPYARALFIAALNAVMDMLGLSDRSIHCKTEGPEQCALEVIRYMEKHYAGKKLVQVGYQPAMLERLSSTFVQYRILDLNEENIGQERYGKLVEHGIDAYEDAVLKWADVVLCTGSTICNGSIVNFLNLEKDVLFYGTTLSGAAAILGLNRLCFADRFQ
jgi:uncharacterized protein (DUF4213/DUF364 family)